MVNQLMQNNIVYLDNNYYKPKLNLFYKMFTYYKTYKELGKQIDYDYVDLGLPSGTLWATCNVGASKPSEYGLYFQWGDTKGYTKDQVGTGDGKKAFT